MPFKLPERVYPHGMTSHHALAKLIAGIESAAAEHAEAQSGQRWQFVRRALSPREVTSLFPATSAVASALVTFLLLAAAVASDNASEAWFLAAVGLLLGAAAAGDVALNCYEQHLRQVEMSRRVSHVVHRLRQVKEQVHWNHSNYPHLHTPLAASLVLQWTLRDRRHVNLPWALLVEGDLVLLKPGQAAPGACHAFDRPDFLMRRDEILHIRTTHHEDGISPTPEFKTPATPQLFVMDETPYLRLIRDVLDRDGSDRPPSILFKHAHLFFTRLLVHYLFPACFGIVLLWNVLRTDQGWSIYVQESRLQLLLLDPLSATLPLLPLAFPLSWVVVNYIALAWVLGVYSSSRHVKMTDDPFEDTLDEPDIRTADRVPLWRMRAYFRAAVTGTGEYLSRTENIVHTLGSITALCCTDKKGILSWPNASPEKIFVVRKERKSGPRSPEDEGQQQEGRKDDEEQNKNFTLVPEILTVTHDRQNPFKVEFDDPTWSKYMNYLKPLGLGILLNTCNVSTEEKYTNFFNHLVCESIRVDDEATSAGGAGDGNKETSEESGSGGRGGRLHKQHNSIDMVPIVTRGCLCELAAKIGFSGRVTQQYSLSSQIQTFRHVEPNVGDKFARKFYQARLKFPFPHLVSVLVQHRTTGSRQLISQGTADIVLDSCTDCWTGDDLDPLSEDLRKKMLDFYQRASLSSYCTAFGFKPQTFQLPWRNCREYLQLPTHSNPFYWQYTEEGPCLDADAVASPHLSVDSKLGGAGGDEEDRRKRDDLYVKTKDDAMICLEMECNQTFLGMIQLQYQAVVDFVQLVDLLEKACIRFVHFSKENELRSRVFSEKMGLESGWNCHISLKSAGNKAKAKMAGRNITDDLGGKKRTSSGGGSSGGGRSSSCRGDGRQQHMEGDQFLKSTMGASLPEKLNRPAWYLDFPKWQEIKGTWSNGTDKGLGRNSYDQEKKSSRLSFDALLQNSSRHASVTSDSDPFEYDMSNRAQLPKGIENIRPHLENMDNVPLLVSLFTDCTPDSTAEMLKIMQEYGEVVCVLGSSANYRNMSAFLQSDASLAIEPRYPQLCQKVPVFIPPKSGPSPVAISQLLNSVASSLSFKMDDEISIFHLIMESRHFTVSMLNVMKFWICCLLMISLLQVLSLLLTLPVFLGVGQTLFASSVAVPLLSLSLLGTKSDPNVMNVSTGKNTIVLNRDMYRYAVWCYGSRFAPAVVILCLCHMLCVVSLGGDCSSSQFVFGNLTVLEEAAMNGTSIDCHEEVGRDLTLPHLLNFSFLHLYLVVISLSFISRGHQLWRRHPGHCPAWIYICSTLLLVVAFYALATALLVDQPGSGFAAPLSAWLLWLLGLPSVVAINELVKRQEIKVEVRHQKRERLEFGTKLGMNSPF